MKQVIAAALFLFLAGCQNNLENASANMKKGDAFYGAKEYDVAEYYYEKIPEESPFFVQARMKLDSISTFRKYWSTTTVSPEDMKNIMLGDHSASMMKATMKPLHSFVIINNTPRTLSTVTIEFTYYDIDHNVVGKLTCDVDAPVPSKNKGVFNRVEPGMLKKLFMKSDAKLIGAEY